MPAGRQWPTGVMVTWCAVHLRIDPVRDPLTFSHVHTFNACEAIDKNVLGVSLNEKEIKATFLIVSDR